MSKLHTLKQHMAFNSYVADDAAYPATYRTGPEGKTPFKAAGTSESGTRSHSSRSTAQQVGMSICRHTSGLLIVGLLHRYDQSRFRDALRDRDGACLLTGQSASRCMAAHIVPVSRGTEVGTCCAID